MHGRVQGVWFRDSMRREAEKLGVNGWVRNCIDSSVEAMVQGDSAAVDSLVAWAHRGPELAQVSRVDEEPGSGSFTGFEVRGEA
ncbi:MAG: acylphosphatase [Gammaproteobacteria bacterium]|nr:acylphosphatase [Gammaproteobacteria bacterium]MBU1625442.1 acylphosphatase [Gammaproteobacteria bacterium]MBU1981702.1 acylphosphatase [Gammaproteobacteria bacterium]